jgi:crotonobetainyl-CoA:carnitine CoA-transferase CaiB-like acyl-CoA transferase
MSRLLEGVRVIEVSMWGFVPTTGVVLADWGAEVVKIEHPDNPDPARGLMTSSWVAGKNGVRFLFEIFNRGKRCVAINLSHPDGRMVLYRLLEGADVFVTSLRADARERLGISAKEISKRFPHIVYASGSGLGTDGPDANQGGYDLSAYWSRAGTAFCVTPKDSPFPADMPSPGFGDVPSGTILAGGIAAALFRKERTGQGSVIDLSLLNAGMWAISGELTATEAIDADRFYKGDGRIAGNPLVAMYRTKDNRFIQLVMTDGDRHFADFCEHLGRPDLIQDPRFNLQAARRENSDELIAILETIFSSAALEDWTETLEGTSGVWAAVRGPREVPHDPQVVANGYVRTRYDGEGRDYLSVVSPVRAIGDPDEDTRPAPKHGEHTDEVLLGIGLEWDDLISLKLAGAIL